MKFKLNAGSDIDILTPEELERILRDIRQELTDNQQTTEIFDMEQSIIANAAGVIPQTELWEVPLGYMATIHRWHFNAPGVNPAAPLATVGNWLEFFRNDSDGPNNMFFFMPVSGNQIAPAVIEEGSFSGRVLKGGTKLMVIGAGFAANQQLYINMQVKLDPWTNNRGR